MKKQHFLIFCTLIIAAFSCQRPNNTAEMNKMIGNEPAVADSSVAQPYDQVSSPCDLVNEYIGAANAYINAIENYENGSSASLNEAIANMVLVQKASMTLQNLGNDIQQLNCWDDYSEYVARVAEASSMVDTDADYLRLLNEANSKATKMMNEANRQTNQMMQDAEAQTNQMMREAERNADRMMRDAEREADQMMRESGSDY